MWMWSWVLTGTGVVSIALAGRRPVLGWGIGLASQGLWVTYSIQSHQYGFLASAGLFTVVYGRNWWEARRTMRPSTPRVENAGRRNVEMARHG